MTIKGTVLIVGRDEMGRRAVARLLQTYGYTSCQAATAEAALVQMGRPDLGLIFLELDPRIEDSLVDFVQQIRNGGSNIPIIASSLVDSARIAQFTLLAVTFCANRLEDSNADLIAKIRENCPLPAK